eukprot:CAMPEP_0198448898 /NCGR_PEP_ID=MMETSP1453-20131121/3841_1 /TAXON_ID=1461543 ORGANISM="Unidentified sp., Strain RCC701" /NCGR_SAMPLE_ID=MMETSP1453 /ASSEMBLY_ACC=CAM_ASM_001118 /LENGTH=95 /DNA_ID=CAMNT_0044171517 /DNA_START=130 /DNA_END=414 /DNA_ORIENTATION=-
MTAMSSNSQMKKTHKPKSELTEMSSLIEETKRFKMKKLNVEAQCAYKVSLLELKNADIKIDEAIFNHRIYKARKCLVLLLAVCYFGAMIWFTVHD